MPSWEIHRKWEKKMLRDHYDENKSNNILEIIDMPQKAGYELIGHDAKGKKDALIVELGEKYETYGLLAGALHFLLDDLRDWLQNEYKWYPQVKRKRGAPEIMDPKYGTWHELGKGYKKTREVKERIEKGPEISERDINKAEDFIKGMEEIERDSWGEEVKNFMKKNSGSETPKKFVLDNLSQILKDISSDLVSLDAV